MVNTIIESRIAASTDDAEEKLSTGGVTRTSTDLELVTDGANNQLTGMRFTGLDIPPGAVIVNAYIQFTVDEISAGAASLVVGGELTDNALAFSNTDGDISSRSDTTASVAWTPPDWTTVGASGTEQQTSDISAVIQEIIGQTGWAQGNALVLTISGSGTRTAESFNGSPASAPLLHIEYALPADGVPTIDLDGDDSSGATGANFATAFVVEGDAVAIADTDAVVADSDSNLVSAIITITNSAIGDFLAAGTLPAGITVDLANSTATTLILIGDATPGDYATAIKSITFDTSATPVLGDRAIEVTVNDGTTNSAVATATVTVSPANTPPEALPDGFDASAGIPLVITASELTANDSDSDGDVLTITAVTDPANGTAVLNPDGTVTYTSLPGYSGTDSFDYTISDGDGGTASATVTATVTAPPANTPPEAVADGLDATTGVARVITASELTGNDSDADGDALTITEVTDPANGTAVLNADGSITYTSLPGYSGADSFDYTISDGNGGTASATVIVDVIDPGVTQIVESRIAATSDDAEEETASGSVNRTSSDLELADDGTANQLIGMRFTGLDIPPDAVIVNAYIQFTVDEVSTGTSALVIGGELADNAQTFTSVDGDISSRPDTTASVAWTPPDWTTVGANGTDQQTSDISAVIQEIVDQSGWTQGNALVLTISGSGKRTAESYNGSKANAPLLHVEYTVPADGAPTIDLDGDDSSGATGTDFATAFAAQGTAVAIADADAVVTDSDSNLVSASISITNSETGDILVAGGLPSGISVDQANSTATALILIGDATPADYATAIKSITFDSSATPVAGGRIIEVTVNDGTTDSAIAITTITVSPANTPPEAIADGLDATAGVARVIAASELTGNDSDADGDALTIIAVTDPTNGSAVLNADGTVTYTSLQGYSGTDSFDYTISDGNGGTASATVTATVTAPPTNTPPGATPDGLDAVAGVPLVIAASELTGNDSDADGDALTITAITNPDTAAAEPANGTAVLNADGTVTYTSVPGYSGTDSFDYTISDGNGGTATTTVTVDVVDPGQTQIAESRIAASADDAEEKIASGSVNRTSSDLELSIDGSANQMIGMRFTGLDIPPDAVIVNAYIQFTVDEVSTGTASLEIGGELSNDSQTFSSVSGNISSRSDTTASVAWTPPDWTTVGDNGIDQQTTDISAVIQEIVDQSGWTQGGAIALTISGTGRRTAESYNGSKANAPLLHVEYTVPADGVPTIDLDGNDSSGATGADFAANFAAQGAALAIADTDTVVSDSDSNLVSARIAITNSETGDVLSAGSLPAGITVDQANSTAAVLILIGDATPADYATAIQAITFDSSASPTLGDRTIEVTVNDGTTDSAVATTTVTVSPINTPPEASADGFDATAGIPLVMAATDLTGNDSDADGDALTITAVTNPANGTAVLNADGTVTYASVPGYDGADSFDYTISDGNGGTASATVTVDVVDAGLVQTIESRISASSDDAEEIASTGGVSTSSSDLELVRDLSRNQLVGMRFTGLDIPPDVVILSAYVQFTVDEFSDGGTSLVITGENSDNAQTFSTADGDISSRPTTDASVTWAPPDWTSVGDSGLDQRSADIAIVIQEIVDRPGWNAGGALALTISNIGKRTANSFDGNQSGAPLLHIEYEVPTDGIPRIDLDQDNQSGGSGRDFATTFAVQGAPVAIADTDRLITDSNNTTLISASITITNPEAGDALVVGALTGGIVADLAPDGTSLILSGTATLDDYADAIEAITFDNPLTDPVRGARAIEVTVNDGTFDSPVATTTVSVENSSFEFYVIADVPYNDGEFVDLHEVLSIVPEEAKFVIHLGDIKGGSNSVDADTYFPQVSSALQTSTKPLFLLLGDNEFNDMPDPEAAFDEWSANFMQFDQHWIHDLGVSYQDVRPENFSFVIDDTLFIGLNLVGSSVHDADEWAARSADDLAWVEDMFGQFGNVASNAVLFAHAFSGHSGYAEFENGFLTVAQDFEKPILYLQGDSHTWKLDNPYTEAENITRIIVNRTGPNSPLQVTVEDDPDDPFSADHDFGGFFL